MVDQNHQMFIQGSVRGARSGGLELAWMSIVVDIVYLFVLTVPLAFPPYIHGSTSCETLVTDLHIGTVEASRRVVRDHVCRDSLPLAFVTGVSS
jgi:hypothetical protein